MRKEKARWRVTTHVQRTFFRHLETCVYLTSMKMCEVRSERAVLRIMCVRQVSVYALRACVAGWFILLYCILICQEQMWPYVALNL